MFNIAYTGLIYTVLTNNELMCLVLAPNGGIHQGLFFEL